MSHVVRTSLAAEQTVDRIKAIIATEGVTRAGLNVAKQELELLARQSELWLTDIYPNPVLPELTTFYLIHQDEETGMSLYLNIMLPGEKTPVHNHTTWACIASVEGEETNHLFERTDDRSQPGKARLESKGVWPVIPGNPIGVLPDDVHYVTNEGTTIVKHLHLYGNDVKDLTKRLMFNVEEGTYEVMPLIAVDAVPAE